MATTGKGAIAVGSEQGDIRLFSSSSSLLLLEEWERLNLQQPDLMRVRHPSLLLPLLEDSL